MPKDDPESNRFMKSVDGMKGYKAGKTMVSLKICELDWEQQLPQYVLVKEDGTIVLNVDSVPNLAYVNSTSYQRSLEELYLSAARCRAERFRFQTQFFGGNDTDIAAQGTGTSTPLTTRTDASFDRRFATAGTLATDLPTRLSGSFPVPTPAPLFLCKLQPNPTLAAQRWACRRIGDLDDRRTNHAWQSASFQRYRQGFYTDIAIGGGTGGPSRRGGFRAAQV